MSSSIPAGDTPIALNPAPAAILETSIYSEDLDAAERFYSHVMGLELLRKLAGRHLFYRLGHSMLLIFDPRATITGSDDIQLPVPPHGARGESHICFAVTAAEMPSWMARLDVAEIPVEADFHWPNGARSIYFRDPAGNSVELAEPRLWFPEE